jgi:hypothetical protein
MQVLISYAKTMPNRECIITHVISLVLIADILAKSGYACKKSSILMANWPPIYGKVLRIFEMFQ